MIYNLFNKQKSKKGSVNDPIAMGAVLLTLGITIFIVFYLWTGFSTAILSSTDNLAGFDEANSTIQTLTASYAAIDYMIPLLTVGFMLVSLILAFKTGASITYAFLSLISWGFAILMATVYTNIFEAFSVSFPVVANTYPILTYIMFNFKWIVIGWLFLISIVMFTRNKQEDTSLNEGLASVYA